jgi:high-affinity iron transporter
VLANFLIGIREGLEASIIVGILISFAVKVERRDVVAKIWWGVASAAVVAFGAGAAIFFLLAEAGDALEPIITGVLSILAAALLTWMIFWMSTASRSLKGTLEGSLGSKLTGSGLSIAIVAFTAVVREGIETALFIWASVTSTGEGWLDVVMALAGIAVSALIGWFGYRGLVRINLAKFFRWTSFGLLIVAAGLVSYGVAELQEVGVLPSGAPVWDLSPWLGEQTVLGSFLKGLIAFQAAPTMLQVGVWLAYAVPTLMAFVRSNSKRVPATTR